MTKEKFLYELIDNWLYMVSWECVVMENYTQKDRTKDYIDCSDKLKSCLDFYDSVYAGLNSSQYTQPEVDEKLEYIIQSLKQETMRRFISNMESAMKAYVSDVNKVIRENLLCDQEGNRQEISKDTLSQFIIKLRELEIDVARKGTGRS